MARPGIRAALLVALFLPLAGCVDGSASGSPAAPKGGSVRQGTADVPDAGTIQGQVVDDAVTPLAGALVQLQEISLDAVTDEAGRFEFVNLVPQTYTVYVAKLGYSSVARRIEVPPNGLLTPTFTLEPIPIVVARHELLGPWNGYFECRLGTPTQTGECGWVSVLPHPTFLYPNDKSIFHFNMTSDDYETFIGEMRWQPGVYATSQAMRLAFSWDGRTGTHRWCSREMGTPLWFRYENPDDQYDIPSVCTETGDGSAPREPTTKLPLRVYSNMPFGSTSTSNPQPVYLAVQQRYSVMVSIWYGEPAPEGFSAWTDR